VKQCENCEEDHSGKYASGRFCSQKCSRSFSTKSKRKEINEKVSKTLSGRKPTGIKKHSQETKERISQSHLKRDRFRLTLEQKRARNLAKVNAYHARKRNASHPEADLELIKKIYEFRPEGYHVDHIVAIADGGLHHESNLQYLPASENCRKCAGREYDMSLAIPWEEILKEKESSF
jgi:hypothetical protein